MKKFWLLVGALGVALALPACVPTFPASGVLAVTPAGSGGTLVWTRASDPDEGQTVASYRVDVDGVEVARVDAVSNTCVLSGLDEGSHAVEVTAYDSVNDWSGNASSGGRVTAELTAPEPVDPPSAIACVPPVLQTTDSIEVDGVVIGAEVQTELGVALSEASSGVSAPQGVTLEVDAVTVQMSGVAVGSVAETQLDLDAPMDTVNQLVDGTWSPFPYDDDTGIRVAGHGLTVSVTARDGGRGDADGATNGVVSVTLGLGVTEELAGAPNPPLELEQSLPQTAPGWSEARPAIATIIPAGTWAPRYLVA